MASTISAGSTKRSPYSISRRRTPASQKVRPAADEPEPLSGGYFEQRLDFLGRLVHRLLRVWSPSRMRWMPSK